MKNKLRYIRKTKLVLLAILIFNCITPLQMATRVGANEEVRNGNLVNIIDKFQVYHGNTLLLETTDLSEVPASSTAISYAETLKYVFTWSDIKLTNKSDKIEYGDMVEVKIPYSEGIRYSGVDIYEAVYSDGDLIGHYVAKKVSGDYVLQMIFDNPDYDYENHYDYKGSFYIDFSLTYKEDYNSEERPFSLNINNEVYVYKLKPANKPYPSDYRKWGELEKFNSKYVYDAVNDRYTTGFTLSLNQAFNKISNSPENPVFVYDKLDTTISDIKYKLTSEGIPNIMIHEYTYADQFSDLADKKTSYMNHYYTYTINGNKNVCQLYSTNPNETALNTDGSPIYSQALVDAIQFDPNNSDNFTIDLGFLGNFDHPIKITYSTTISGVGIGDLLNDWTNIPGAKDYLKYIGNSDSNSMTITVNGTVVNTDKSGSYTSFSTSGAEASNTYGIVRVTKYNASIPTKKLEAAEFKVYKADDTYVCTITTDETGSVTSPHLAPGSYYMVETKAPEGFILDPQKREFTLIDSGEAAHLLQIYDIPNSPMPSIKINKVSNNNTIIDTGMIFELRDGVGENAEVISTLNNMNEYTSEKLPVGTYYLYEKVAPVGYEGLTTFAAKFTVNSDGTITTDETNANTTHSKNTGEDNVYTYTIPNERETAGLVFTKEISGLSTEAKAAIVDETFSFTITGPDSYEETFSLPKDGSWSYTVQDLPTGEYTITETDHGTNPTGYIWTGNGTGKKVINVSTSSVGDGSITNTYKKDVPNSPETPETPVITPDKPVIIEIPESPKNPDKINNSKHPDTGDFDGNMYLPLLLVSQIGLGSILVYQNKSKKYKRIKNN